VKPVEQGIGILALEELDVDFLGQIGGVLTVARRGGEQILIAAGQRLIIAAQPGDAARQSLGGVDIAPLG
jgi:hypothetical protein